jgi:hypothetical protein
MPDQGAVSVLPGANFSGHIPDPGGFSEPKAFFLAKVEADGHLSGDWRVALAGTAPLNFVFSGTQIYQSPQLSGKIFFTSHPCFASLIS